MPKWLDRLMSILYPASLGVDEALADLCVRAYRCSHPEPSPSPNPSPHPSPNPHPNPNPHPSPTQVSWAALKLLAPTEELRFDEADKVWPYPYPYPYP